jgi:hypothetical protein
MMHALLAAPLANEASKPAASHIDTTDCEDCGTLGVSVGANCPRCGRLIAAPSVEQDERRANTFTKIGDSLTLTGAQLLEAFEFIAPDHPNDPDQLESEVTIQRGEGHSGDGFYCWVTDYPEEGAILLDGSATPRAASTSANVAQGAEAVEDVPEGCTPADAQVLRAANHALANENDKLRHALAPFARLVSTHTLSWAMVEYCVKGDPEKQTFRHPQMQRAFNRAAAAYSNTAPPVQTALTDDARDATRYRWIRDQGSSLETRQRDKGVINGPSCYHEVEGIRELKWGDSLDEAIDAALTAAQSASGETK